MANEVNKEKLKALQLTMDKMEKTFGKGAVMKLGDDAIEQVEVDTGDPRAEHAVGMQRVELADLFTQRGGSVGRECGHGFGRR